jgi:hypothetical protein
MTSLNLRIVLGLIGVTVFAAALSMGCNALFGPLS